MLKLKKPLTLVLASASPRRQALLCQLGLTPIVQPVDADESSIRGKTPEEVAKKIAQHKFAAAKKYHDLTKTVLVTADTIVSLDNRVFGKPATPEQAIQMLKTLSGRQHQVITAVTVGYRQSCLTLAESTLVEFSPLTDEVIREYVKSGEPLDKAGAYGIQGAAACFVRRLEGCYFNVMGLPLNLLTRMLQSMDVLAIPLTNEPMQGTVVP